MASSNAYDDSNDINVLLKKDWEVIKMKRLGDNKLIFVLEKKSLKETRKEKLEKLDK